MVSMAPKPSELGGHVRRLPDAGIDAVAPRSVARSLVGRRGIETTAPRAASRPRCGQMPLTGAPSLPYKEASSL